MPSHGVTNHVKTTRDSFISRKGLTAKSNDTKKFDHQISGFNHCMTLWYHSMRIRSNKLLTFDFLKKQFKGIQLIDLPKAFKLSCSTYFSQIMRQELPPDSYKLCRDVVEPSFRPLLRKRWQRPRRKIRDLWNLLQVKVAANPVPLVMIKKAYQDHQEALSSIGKTPESTLLRIRQYARQFASRLPQFYREIVPIANSKSSYSHNRDQGGNFCALKPIISSNVLSRGNSMLNGKSTRIDPPCIYIQGLPGIGKSFLSNLIVKELSSRFGEFEPSVYARNYETKHFDGYHGQLIFQIDDAFQKAGNKESDCLVDQMIQIKSNNEFIVPMADLREKGRKFTSEFLLLSSNSSPLDICQSNGRTLDIRQPFALYRRISPYWKLLEFNRNTGQYRVQFISYVYKKNINMYCSDDSLMIRNVIERVEFYCEVNAKRLVQLIVDQAIGQHKEAVSNAYLSIGLDQQITWSIPVIPRESPNEPVLSYNFPLNLPKENCVKAHALAEPLKVRMITKGDSNCLALKPFQLAAFRVLKTFPCMFPGTKMEDLLEKVNLQLGGKKGFILSGDYSAATDGLHMDVMKTCLEEFKKVFPNNIPLQTYLDYEGGKHKIEYPSWTQLDSIIQSNGQLMGSILSFFILCIAVVASFGETCDVELMEDCDCIVNGDDLFAILNSKQIKTWKKISSDMGLKPSIGKNYKSQFFGSFNSQLFIRSKRTLNFKLIKTGKFKTILSPKSLNTSEAFKHGFEKSDIVKFSSHLLKRTKQSLDIPISFGGLGDHFDLGVEKVKKSVSMTDRRIYLQKLIELSDVKELIRLPEKGCSIISGPKYILNIYRPFKVEDSNIISRIQIYKQSLSESLKLDKESDVLFHFDKKIQKEIRHQVLFRNFSKHGILQDSCPLELLKSETMAIPSDLFQTIYVNSKTYLRKFLPLDHSKVDQDDFPLISSILQRQRIGIPQRILKSQHRKKSHFL